MKPVTLLALIGTTALGFTHVSRAEEAPKSHVLFKVFYSGTWGVRAQHNKQLWIHADGTVQCMYRKKELPKRADCPTGDRSEECISHWSSNLESYQTLTSLPPNYLQTISGFTAPLKEKQYVYREGRYRCFHQTHKIYSYEDFEVINQSVMFECGERRVDDPFSNYVEGMLDGLLFQCASSPDEEVFRIETQMNDERYERRKKEEAQKQTQAKPEETQTSGP
jgi:hypothetical protein